MIYGTGISDGIAIARTVYLHVEKAQAAHRHIADATNELERFQCAYARVCEETEILKKNAFENFGEEAAEIFDAHLSILRDTYSIKQPIEDLIVQDMKDASWAVEEHMATVRAIFDAMDDSYMRERADDIRDLAQRLIDVLVSHGTAKCGRNDEAIILVAKELTPSETAKLDFRKIAGIITQTGGKTSHVAIMARMANIPAVSNLPDVFSVIPEHIEIGIDGASGEIFIEPDAATRNTLSAKNRQLQHQAIIDEQFRNKATTTLDARELKLYANIGNPSDAKVAFTSGAEGIGLFRSEFLYMNRASLPTEDEQFNAYRKVLEMACPRQVTVRTLDIGGDKDLPAMHLEKEENPFLGYRAIRICLAEKEIFLKQLRALLRAGLYGNLRIMFPMISSIEELRKAKLILEEAKKSLHDDGVPFQENVPVGIMVEIPSAAIMADAFAKEVDFFSIGTNDLIQYTTAVDRGNPKVADLYNSCNPAVLRLIANTIKAATDHHIPCSMCGEMASDPQMIPLLVGMGLRTFSMNPAKILHNRYLLAQISFEKSAEKAKEILTFCTAEEIRNELERNV